MTVDLILKNYRCFADSQPARITVREGFTAFTGINNSGKSSLLKFFFEFRELFSLLGSPGQHLIHASQNPMAFNLPSAHVLDTNELFYNGNNRDIVISVRVTTHAGSTIPVASELLVTVPRNSNQFTLRIMGERGPAHLAEAQIQETALRGTGFAVELGPYFETFRELHDTLYVGAFRNAIHIGTKENYFDIQIGQSFIRIWQSFQSGGSKNQNYAIIRLIEEIRAIFGLRKLEIFPSDNGQTLHLNINDKPFKLAEVGSGMAQLLVVLANAAVRRPAYILIDEPELNLHPSLQIRFLTALGSYAKKGVLFATHSVGLARATAQLIYSVRQDTDSGASEVKPFEATPRLLEFLGELSFSGYRELGFNRVLLVEGVNEVLAIQQFLRWHNKDHQVMLLSLGGSELINGTREAELRELKRITADIFALIDSERSCQGEALSKDRQDFEDVCKRSGITCHVLERRAIENYFPQAAVQRVKGTNFRALGLYERLKDLGAIGWPKAENWKIAREMTARDLEGTDLGTFLSKTL